MIDPQVLIDQTAPTPLPAPFWFIQVFKVLGFTLHAVPMNLWYAGILVVMLLYAFGSEHGRRFNARLMKQMPVIIAFGVNLGIVPLLFVQVAYHKVFYPATILMAWHWLLIIPMLAVAYYGVYWYVFGMRRAAGLSPVRVAAGWVSALLFIGIGFFFANAMSLMAHVQHWPELYAATQIDGAVLGNALNTADVSLWPRWLMMFGLALTTTAAWVVVDRAFFARAESDAYHAWASGFAWKLYTIGMVWFAAAGSWYVFGTWPASIRQTMFEMPWLILTGLTATAVGLPWLLITLGGRQPSRVWAALVGVAQFGVLGINAISRQMVQNLSLDAYFNPAAQGVDVQWSPLVLFLVTFVAGLGVVIWMVALVVRSLPPAPVQDSVTAT